MKGRFRNIFKKLAFRIVFLVLTVNVLVAIGFYIFILRPFSVTLQNQIITDIHDHAQDIYSMCNQSDMELLRMGVTKEDPSVNVKKGYTLGLIESYMIRNDIEVVIIQDDKYLLRPDAVTVDFASQIHNQLVQQGGTKVVMLDHRGFSYYADALYFDPWNWHIMILKNTARHTALKQDIAFFYAVTVLLLLVGALLLLYYLQREIKVPLNRIISKVQKEELPYYRGTEEFEYLSDNLRGALEQKQIKTVELENLNIALKEEIEERKKTGETLRKSEERFRTLVESAKDAIFILDMKGNIVSWPGAACDMFGYQADEAIGKQVSMLVPDELLEEQKELIKKMMESGYVLKNYETARIKKDGTIFPVEITSNPIRDDQGNITGTCGIIRDITERKKLDKQLLQAQKIEAIGQLAGGIAHDFNNLLAAIVSNVYLSKMYIDPDHKAYKRLETTESALMKAGSLTQQLLTFSKGGAPVKKIMSLVNPVHETAGFALSGSNVSHDLDIADDLWLVEADEGQISRVIHNMVMNADQSMPEGGIVMIRAENLMLDSGEGVPLATGRYIKISITDQGVGIPEDHLPNIFDPYFTTKQKGSGLGLAVSYSIIKTHGGYISVESEVGVGTSMTIYLPASDAEISAEQVLEKRLVHGEGRILLMDDDEIVRNSMRDILVLLGYEIDFAEDGAEAIEKYKEALASSRPFDAVIFDLTVPGGMGGKDAIKRLLEVDPDIIAIVASGYSDDPVMADFREYGFSDVLSKPYNPELLSSVLYRLLNGDSE